jgi:hypothetical protein
MGITAQKNAILAHFIFLTKYEPEPKRTKQMKLVTQAELARQLGCNRSFINQLAKAKDYRLIWKGKKIDLEKTLQAFSDSNYGNKAKSKTKAKTGGNKYADDAKPDDDILTEEQIKEIEQSGEIPGQAVSKKLLEHYKAKNEKLKFETNEGMKINVDEAIGIIFEKFRQLRDRIKNVSDETNLKLVGKDQFEIKNIIDESINKALSDVANVDTDDEQLKKKIKEILVFS